MTVTIRHLAKWKLSHERFTVLTAYDYAFAKWVAKAEIPVILVGDSLGQIMLGYSTTLPVTVNEMVHHTRAVVKAAPGCLIVADMPFLSYQVSYEEAVRNAGRLIKEGGAHAVKIEGGEDMAGVAAALIRADIAVMGHIGLTPQAVHQLGGYHTQGVDEEGQARLLADGRALQAAGVFAVVLEKIPAAAAALLTQELSIPTIGIGSGPECDGQVLVTHDLLGLFSDYTPPFVKRYAELGKAAMDAMVTFATDVRQGRFPEPERKNPE